MRLLVCGGRKFSDRALFELRMGQVDSWRSISCVIEGEAPGADTMARMWAERNGRQCLPFPAQWGAHGKAAGRIRNLCMLRVGEPELVLAFPGGPGTAHMVAMARKTGVTVWEA